MIKLPRHSLLWYVVVLALPIPSGGGQGGLNIHTGAVVSWGYLRVLPLEPVAFQFLDAFWPGVVINLLSVTLVLMGIRLFLGKVSSLTETPFWGLLLFHALTAWLLLVYLAIDGSLNEVVGLLFDVLDVDIMIFSHLGYFLQWGIIDLWTLVCVAIASWLLRAHRAQRS